MPPLRRAGAAVAPSFAWNGVRSGGSSEEKGTRLAYEASRGPFSSEDPPDRTPSRANEGATAAPARLKGGMARSGCTSGKRQGRPRPSGPTFEARRGWKPSPRGVDGRLW
ncbi:hypothetical protein T492DRAFT_890717 [Pavlovales sp. CCMP2436]|nr:hypothetical protein T492DRAFT_890717 [Pavlovales sp. CCMP2436]